VSTDHTAIFPDSSRTRGLSLSRAAGQRRSWLHTNIIPFTGREVSV